MKPAFRPLPFIHIFLNICVDGKQSTWFAAFNAVFLCGLSTFCIKSGTGHVVKNTIIYFFKRIEHIEIH